jgi:cytochrome c-type biogenesis protein CcmH/NrfG
MRAKLTVAILVGVLLLYLVLVGYQGWLLLTSGEAVGAVLGAAILALPLIGAYVVWRELQFGAASQRLAVELAAAGRWPTEELPTRPSGRPDRAAAESVFALRKHEVEQHPDDWRSWYRLGLAYEDAGDRKRARHAVRHAISLSKER